jgi:ubiquinone/menaquinone biosynthesis C-methylase UbiE
MHHWTDQRAALNEIARVLRPEGRALVWDLRRGSFPLHGQLPDPAAHAQGTSAPCGGCNAMAMALRLHLTERIELVREDVELLQP